MLKLNGKTSEIDRYQVLEAVFIWRNAERNEFIMNAFGRYEQTWNTGTVMSNRRVAEGPRAVDMIPDPRVAELAEQFGTPEAAPSVSTEETLGGMTMNVVGAEVEA